MTNLTEVIDLMTPKIPLEMRSDEMIDIELARVGVLNMATALGFESLNITKHVEEVEDPDGEGTIEEVSYTVEPELTFKQLNLAAYYAYGAYLDKLKLAYTNDAINFSTLTFSIKGLEKRPESIGDQIYNWNRYLPNEINRASGNSGGIVGTAVVFGAE